MADYILEPLDTDNEIIFQDFVEFVQQYFPEWEASEGQLDVIIARYFSMQAAFVADMASRVERAIYRYFGASLAGVPPLPGSAATALVHFDIYDPSIPPVDRTLPGGTLVGLTDRDGDIQMFATLDEAVVPAGDATIELQTQAIELGAISNNISGTVVLIEQIDWISNANVVGVSSGGSDPEEDDVYMERLTQNLGLMAPRPILAQDFAVMALNVPGVWRASVLDNFRPGNMEVQRLTSNYTGGTWTLNFLGKVTPAIPAAATAINVRDAMSTLTNFDITDADFSGGPLPATPITITFKGKYAYQDVAAITVVTTGLTGGSSFTVAEVTKGTVYALDQGNAIGISAVDEAGGPLDATTKQNLIDYLAQMRAQNFIITFVDPAYYPIDVTYAGHAFSGADPAAVKTNIDDSLFFYMSPEQYGQVPYQSASRTWFRNPTVRYLELTTVAENTPGLDYLDSLTFAMAGGAASTADKSFSAPFALTIPGAINGTVAYSVNAP